MLETLLGDRWPLILLLATLLLVALLALLWERRRPSVASRRRNRQARRGERAAEALLARYGYRVVERQARVGWNVVVDGEARSVWSQVDLLVERDHRLYLADVKTGDEAPSPSAPATRRQLLEYQLAFGVDGVLLVDMAEERILTIDFSDLLRRI